MRLVHNATVSVFVKQNELLEETKKALTSLFPINLEKEKVAVKEESAQGFDKKITIISVTISKEAHLSLFFKNLRAIMRSDELLELSSQENRLHEEEGQFVYYIRLDKKKWIEKREAKLIDTGDCFHIRLVLAPYPKKKENAIKIVNQLFQEKAI